MLKELVRHLDFTNKPEMTEFTFRLISTFFDVIEKVRSREDKAKFVQVTRELIQMLTPENAYLFSIHKMRSQLDICLKSLEMWPDYEEWLDYIRQGGTLSFAEWFLQRIRTGFLQTQPTQLWCGIVPQGFRIPEIIFEDAAAIRKVKKLLPGNK